MSTTARNAVLRQYTRVLGQWPKDALRPDCQLQDAISRRLERRFPQSQPQSQSQGAAPAEPAEPFNPKQELAQLNALYSLVTDRYKTKYRPDSGSSMFEPKSKPTYYTDLARELEEAPHRSWLQRLGKRLGGMFRLST